MDFTNRFASSKEVKIHYIESEIIDNQLTPLVYVPGALNYAEQSMNCFKNSNQEKVFH